MVTLIKAQISTWSKTRVQKTCLQLAIVSQSITPVKTSRHSQIYAYP